MVKFAKKLLSRCADYSGKRWAILVFALKIIQRGDHWMILSLHKTQKLLVLCLFIAYSSLLRLIQHHIHIFIHGHFGSPFMYYIIHINIQFVCVVFLFLSFLCLVFLPLKQDKQLWSDPLPPHPKMYLYNTRTLPNLNWFVQKDIYQFSLISVQEEMINEQYIIYIFDPKIVK